MNFLSNHCLITSGSFANNNNISVWDGFTGVNLMNVSGYKCSNNSIAIIKDTVIACVESKALFEIWRLNSQGKKKIIPLPVPAKAVVYNEKMNVLCCFLGFDIYIWQPQTGQLLTILANIHSHAGSQILFTGNNVITIDESGLIAFWRVDFSGETEIVWKRRPFDSGNRLFACLIDRHYELFLVSQSGKFISISLINGSPTVDMKDLGGLSVHCITRNADRIFIGCNKGRLVIYSFLQHTVVREHPIYGCEDADHAVTHLALSPDRKSLILVCDGQDVFTIPSYDGCFIPKAMFKFGVTINGLLAAAKIEDLFEESVEIIKRLNFSVDEPNRNRMEIRMKQDTRSAAEIIASLDTSCNDSFDRILSVSPMQNDRKSIECPQKLLFDALRNE